MVRMCACDELSRAAQQENAPPGCSKRPSSKAAASEGPEAYPLGYVEGLNDARTKLADFLSILLVAAYGGPGPRRWRVENLLHIAEGIKRIDQPAWPVCTKNIRKGQRATSPRTQVAANGYSDGSATSPGKGDQWRQG